MQRVNRWCVAGQYGFNVAKSQGDGGFRRLAVAASELRGGGVYCRSGEDSGQVAAFEGCPGGGALWKKRPAIQSERPLRFSRGNAPAELDRVDTQVKLGSQSECPVADGDASWAEKALYLVQGVVEAGDGGAIVEVAKHGLENVIGRG